MTLSFWVKFNEWVHIVIIDKAPYLYINGKQI